MVYTPDLRASNLHRELLYWIEAVYLLFNDMFSWVGAATVDKKEDHSLFRSSDLSESDKTRKYLDSTP
jgi:hypothetical protein